MSNSDNSEPNPSLEAPEANEANESFSELLSQYEKSHARKPAEASKGLVGTVVAVTADSVLLDIGFKTEGILPLTAFESGEEVKPGDTLPVTIKGRDPEGYYELARGRIERPKDWASLEKAFAEHSAILGTVTGMVSVWTLGSAPLCRLRAAECVKPPTWKSLWGRKSAAAS